MSKAGLDAGWTSAVIFRLVLITVPICLVLVYAAGVSSYTMPIKVATRSVPLIARMWMKVGDGRGRVDDEGRVVALVPLEGDHEHSNELLDGIVDVHAFLRVRLGVEGGVVAILKRTWSSASLPRAFLSLTVATPAAQGQGLRPNILSSLG